MYFNKPFKREFTKDSLIVFNIACIKDNFKAEGTFQYTSCSLDLIPMDFSHGNTGKTSLLHRIGNNRSDINGH